MTKNTEIKFTKPLIEDFAELSDEILQSYILQLSYWVTMEVRRQTLPVMFAEEIIYNLEIELYLKQRGLNDSLVEIINLGRDIASARDLVLKKYKKVAKEKHNSVSEIPDFLQDFQKHVEKRRDASEPEIPEYYQIIAGGYGDCRISYPSLPTLFYEERDKQISKVALGDICTEILDKIGIIANECGEQLEFKYRLVRQRFQPSLLPPLTPIIIHSRPMCRLLDRLPPDVGEGLIIVVLRWCLKSIIKGKFDIFMLDRFFSLYGLAEYLERTLKIPDLADIFNGMHQFSGIYESFPECEQKDLYYACEDWLEELDKYEKYRLY